MSNKRSRTRGRAIEALGWSLVAAAVAMFLAVPALGNSTPLNDLFALGQGTGDTPAKAPIVKRQEPPFVATPLARCGRGSHPEPGVDGRVPAGSATHGLSCNVTLVGHQGTE